ncbi:MAG: general secretion pathway protein GspK [Armatimonadetes bacterium]|nr:general secretion pathway protein GspK [Armatimonadota bacterium]
MSRRRTGYIFVQALAAVAVLVALLAMLAADQRAASQEVQDRLRLRRAEAAADAAVARALATLQNADPSRVTLNDDWAALGEGGGDAFDLGDGAAFRVQVVDAGSQVNVNTAPAPQLQRLPLSPAQADCLLDWREPGAGPRADGAKDGYYNALPQPYNARLGPLATLDELLLVRGWTAQMLYGTTNPDTSAPPLTDALGNAQPLAAFLTVDSGAPNTRPDGTPRLNLSQGGADAGALTQLGLSPVLAGQIGSRPFKSFQELFSTPGMTPDAAGRLLDAVTFTGDQRVLGKINVNTADQSVLETIPDMTADIAAAIVAQQAAGFDGLAQLAAVPGMTPQVLAQVADAVTVGGDTWIVRAYGRSGGVGVAVEATVGLRGGRPQVVTWERLRTAGVPAWWGWDDAEGATVDARGGR